MDNKSKTDQGIGYTQCNNAFHIYCHQSTIAYRVKKQEKEKDRAKENGVELFLFPPTKN